MADFRMKLFTLAGAATVFAGMAFGQQTVISTGFSSNAVFIRSEGVTEQVADSTVTMSTVAGGTVAAATVNLTVYLSPAVTITSATVNKLSEAVAVIGGTNYNGTVSGSSVSFTGIPVPAGGGTITITNIKVNASTVATGSGIPTGITETVFVSGTGVTPTVPNPATVAYVTAGLGKVAIETTTNGTINTTNVSICSGSTSAAAAFGVLVSEGFATAFKNQGTAGTNVALGSWLTNNTETGYGVTNGGAASGNTATSGTRFTITFANVPANVAVYVPLTVNYTVGGFTSTVTLQVSATAASGASNNATASTATGAPATSGAVTISNGSGTAVYEETTNNPAAIETYTVPVYLVAAAAGVTAPSGAITATVSLAPIGATSNVPNFVSNASTQTVSGSTFTACTTTLLFPYVTNSSGFETGIAIANAGADLLGTNSKTGAAQSSVTGASGTCLLTFFGSATAAPYTTPATIAPGAVWSSTLTAASGVTGFTGYAIASCNFLYGHGYAFIETGLGTTSGVAEGYLALEVPGTRTASSAAPESLNN
jgi:hypothetical protein